MRVQVDLAAGTYYRLAAVAYEQSVPLDELVVTILTEWYPPRPRLSVVERVAAHRERRRQARYGADYRMRLCEYCGGEMPAGCLPNARYCTSRCRQAGYRARMAAGRLEAMSAGAAEYSPGE